MLNHIFYWLTRLNPFLNQGLPLEFPGGESGDSGSLSGGSWWGLGLITMKPGEKWNHDILYMNLIIILNNENRKKIIKSYFIKKKCELIWFDELFCGIGSWFCEKKLTLFTRSAMVYGEYAFVYGVKLKQQTYHWVYDLPTNRGHFPLLSCFD